MSPCGLFEFDFKRAFVFPETQQKFSQNVFFTVRNCKNTLLYFVHLVRNDVLGGKLYKGMSMSTTGHAASVTFGKVKEKQKVSML